MEEDGGVEEEEVVVLLEAVGVEIVGEGVFVVVNGAASALLALIALIALAKGEVEVVVVVVVVVVLDSVGVLGRLAVRGLAIKIGVERGEVEAEGEGVEEEAMGTAKSLIGVRAEWVVLELG